MSLPTARRPSERLLSRVALMLYPPAWRDRYGAEVRAVLDDAGGGAAAALSLAWRALPAWLWPPKHLHDRDARMRSALATVLASGAMLTGAGLLFAQLTQFQGFTAHGNPVVLGSYAVFDAAMAVTAVSGAIAGLPLWLVMLRRAQREHRPRDTAYLLIPIIVPPSYLAVLAIVSRLAGGPHGVSPWVFLAMTLVGFGAAGLTCAGPILALRRLRPRGPAVRLAVRAGTVATAAAVLAGAASIVAVTGLVLWARAFAGFHSAGMLGSYAAVVACLASAACTGAARGLRGTR